MKKEVGCGYRVMAGSATAGVVVVDKVVAIKILAAEVEYGTVSAKVRL